MTKPKWYRDLFDQACALVDQGLPVFPVRRDKTPATPNGFHDAVRDRGGIARLWLQHRGPLIGVVTGAPSGIAVLDCDVGKGGLEWLERHFDDLPRTRVHQSQSGGFHLYYKHQQGLRNSAGMIAPGVDVRADGGLIIWWPAAGFPVPRDVPLDGLAPWPDWLVPPAPRERPDSSMRFTDHRTRVNRSANLADSLAGSISQGFSEYRQASRLAGLAAPARSHARLRAYAIDELVRAADRIAAAPTGARNATLNSSAFRIARFVRDDILDPREVAETLARAALLAGLDETEVERTLASAFRAAVVR